MILLKTQIKSIFFSFLYGVFFSFMLSLNYKFIFYTEGIVKILINFLFILDNVFLYFILLRFINNGIVHYYFIFSIILGFFSVNKISNKLFRVENKNI